VGDGRPANQAERLAEVLQSRIAQGELPLGSWIRQESIAAEFGVSRTPVREALQVLQARGIVDLNPHRGALIRTPTAKEIQEAYLVRAELEGVAAELAARLATQAQIDRLLEAEELFARALDAVRDPALHEGRQLWSQANDTFHEVVQEASFNARLREAIAAQHLFFARNRTWESLRDDARMLRVNVAEHQRVREAIERGDGPTARAAMRDHIMHSGELVSLRGPAAQLP